MPAFGADRFPLLNQTHEQICLRSRPGFETTVEPEVASHGEEGKKLPPGSRAPAENAR